MDNIKQGQEKLNDLILSGRYVTQDIGRYAKAEETNEILNSEILDVLNEIEGRYFDVSGENRYRNFETQDIPYSVLRRIGDTEPARLIKNKRRYDLSQYAQIPRNDSVQRGCRLVFTNPDYNPTKDEKALLNMWQQRIVDNLYFVGSDKEPNFAKFIAAAYENWFDVDDITIEYRRDGGGRLLSLHLQDPILYKPVIKRSRIKSIHDAEDKILEEALKDYTSIYIDDKLSDKKEPDYLLVYNNRRIAGLTRDVIQKLHMFSNTDFRYAQRGYSIVEQGLNMVSFILSAIKMNASNFSNNRLPDGLLAFTRGGASPMQMEKLKKILMAHMTGASNRNRFPMVGLQGEGDVKWVNTRASSKDMEYHLWITLLFSIWCQLSGTDPKEISLGSHSDAVGRDSLFREATDGIIKESRDTGAKAFLKHLADGLNATDEHGMNIYQEITGMDVRLQFVGFEMEDKKARIDMTSRELTQTRSMNDLLAAEDKEKYQLMVGGVNLYDVPGIQNPQIFQAVMYNAQMKRQDMMQQQQQMQQMGQMQGAKPQAAEERQLTDADKSLLQAYGEPKDEDEEQDEQQDENQNIDNQIKEDME